MADRALLEILRSWEAPGGPLDGPVRFTSSARLPLPASYAGAGPKAEQPGRFPFTRGIIPRGYLDDLWVMGMYSGYASPKETNARFRSLLAAGQTGLSIALDLPTQIGIDSDHAEAAGEVGKVGVPINTVEDMLALLVGLPLHQVKQMRSTANAIGPIFAAFVLVALEELGIEPASFRLLLQNGPLKSFTARAPGSFRLSQAFFTNRCGRCRQAFPQLAAHPVLRLPSPRCRRDGCAGGGRLAANGIAPIDEAVRRGIPIAGSSPLLCSCFSHRVSTTSSKRLRDSAQPAAFERGCFINVMRCRRSARPSRFSPIPLAAPSWPGSPKATSPELPTKRWAPCSAASRR